jgi:hypothetical protein
VQADRAAAPEPEETETKGKREGVKAVKNLSLISFAGEEEDGEDVPAPATKVKSAFDLLAQKKGVQGGIGLGGTEV